MEDISILMENGIYLRAKGFGDLSAKYVYGEMVFNTSLTGYQEIITDPSYAGQFVIFTMPEIGIVGFNDIDNETCNIMENEAPKPLQISGVIIRNLNEFASNFRSQESMISFFKKHKIFGITNIDTRFLVKLLRVHGTLNMVASNKANTKHEIKKLLTICKRDRINYVERVSTNHDFVHEGARFDFETMNYKKSEGDIKIVAIDFGIKKNILHELSNIGFCIKVISYKFKAKQLIDSYEKGKIKGVFLSNGPGNPMDLINVIKEIKELIKAKIPIFGICLGHQLLSIAHGFNTYKMPFGQHGANHPVKNLKRNAIEITSQNHIYGVPETIQKVAYITHRNLFDYTIEGVKYKEGKIISLQHHPEASPGPHEGSSVFKEFLKLIEN